MSGTGAKSYVVPNFRAARLFGIFNVLFAAQILVCGLGMSMYAASLPFVARAMTQMQKAVDVQSSSRKQQMLADVETRREAAKTEEEKVRLDREQRDIEARPNISVTGGMDMSKLGMDDPTLIGWSWVEILSGLGLNVLLVLSGIGLMHWKGWGRRLGVWVAVLKILRLVVVYSFFVIAIVPPFSQRLGHAVGDMLQAQGGVITPKKGAMAPGPELFARIYTITYSVTGVGFILFGSVYPAILMWGLTRPGVVVACSGTHRLPKEPNQP